MSKTGATAGSARATHRLARSLRQRDAASCMLRVTPLCLSVGALTWSGITGVSHWFQYPVPEVELAGLIGILSVATTAIIGQIRARSHTSMLLQADQSLNLPNTLSNGAQLQDRHDPFSQAAVQESERVALSIGRKQLGQIAPLWTLRGRAALVAGLALAASGGMIAFTLWWAPQPGASSTISQDVAQSLIEEAAAALAPQSALTPDALSAQTTSQDPIAARARAELDAIEQELRNGTSHPQDAAFRAARALEIAANDAASASKVQQEIADSTAESLSKAAASLSRESPNTASTTSQELTRSIAQADLERAAALADEIASRPAELSQEQREQLAAELQSMADSLQHEATPAAAGPEQHPAQDPSTNLDTNRSQPSPTSRSTSAESQSAPQKQDIAQALERAASSLREPPSPRSEKAETRDKPSQSSTNNSSVPPDQPPRNREQVGAAKPSESGTRANQASEQSKDGQPKPSEASSTTDRAQSNSSEKQTSSQEPNRTSQNGSRSSDSERPASPPTESQNSTPRDQSSPRQGTDTAQAAKSPDTSSDNSSSSKADAPRPGSHSNQTPGSTPKTSESPQKSPTPSKSNPAETAATDPRNGTQPHSTGSNQKSTERDSTSQSGSNPQSESSSGSSAGPSKSPSQKPDTAQADNGKPIGPPTSRTSDQLSDPNKQQKAPQDKVNALSQLAQKLRSVDRARQGQDTRSQEWRQKAQELLSKSEPPPSNSASDATGSNSRSEVASQSSTPKTGLGGMQPRDGQTGTPSSSQSTMAGASDSNSSQRPHRSGASQQIEFNPAREGSLPLDRDRVIAELPSRESAAPLTPNSSNASSLSESLQRARQQADRAIESQSIPREYQDLIRRVFRRYESRSNLPSGAPKPSDDKLSPDATPAQPGSTIK